MKWLAYGLLAICSLTMFQAVAKEPDVEVVDPLINSIFRSLAQRQGFNLLSAPDQEAAKIGNIYYVTEPSCASDLTSMAREGVPVRMFLAWDLPTSEVPVIATKTDWTSIRLGSVLGKSARAELFGSIPDKKAELKIALSALDQTNAQIFFGTRQTGSVRIKRAMEKELKAQGISSASDLGNDAAGAIAPHAELVVQKFEFDKNAVRDRQAGLVLRFMEIFGARLASNKDVSTAYGYRLPTYSTAAFKPVAALFNSTSCTANVRAKSPAK